MEVKNSINLDFSTFLYETLGLKVNSKFQMTEEGSGPPKLLGTIRYTTRNP